MKMTKYDRNAPCWCGSGKKYKHCHEAFDEKIREFEVRGAVVPDRSIIKTPKDVEGIRKSAVINIAVLDEVADKIHAGMSTQGQTFTMKAIPRASARRSMIRYAMEFPRIRSF